LLRWAFQLIKPVAAIPPEEGARTIIYLASSPDVEGVSGDYFAKCRVAVPTPAARNDGMARRLWEMSARIMGEGA
jgi:hypothetical protein